MKKTPPPVRHPRRRRKHLVAVATVAVILSASALLNTAAVSAAMPGRVGPPDTITPVATRAPAEEPDLRLVVLGDVGTGEADELAVAERASAAGAPDPFDGLILLGDNVYPDGNPERLQATVFDPFEPVLSAGAELLPVLGNHDIGYADGQMAALGMPGRWYAAEFGDVLFLGLDSNDPENPAQLLWLEETLASSDAPHIVAAMHHPPFSAGVHGSDEDTREAFAPLFERYGVDVVLAGHDHDYQRSVPIGGVTYVVSGAGAKVRPTGTAEFTAVSAATLHFLELAVWSDRIELQAIGLDGAFDRAVIDTDPAADPPTALGFATAAGLIDDEPSAGARLAGIGALVWLFVVAASWLTPATAVGRFGKAMLVVSTASMATALTGLGMVTVALVT